MTFDDLLSRLDGVRRTGPTKATARCAAHDDREASLSVAVGSDGTLLLHCFRGCSFEAITTALGVNPAELSPKRAKKAKDRQGEPAIHRFDYRDEGGAILYTVVRRTWAPKNKEILPYLPGSDRAGLGDVRRVVYRLPQLKRQRVTVYTEGEVKADLLWDWGLPATTHCSGANAWRPDYLAQMIAAGVRTIVVCPDHDGPGYALGAAIIKAAQESGLVTVRWLTLPGLAVGEDVMDWAARGGTAEEFRRLMAEAPVVETALEWIEPGREGSAAGASVSSSVYTVQDGALCRVKQTQHGPVAEPLCNFVARVAEEWLLDDGQESARAFVLEGRLASGAPLPRVRVPVDKFSAMAWPLSEWGLYAVVRAGISAREYLREAIQALSGTTAQQHRVYTHTGWRQLPQDGPWVYLTASGAVGREDCEVELEEKLRRYRLPQTADDPVRALQASLRLLQLGPLMLTVPLLGSVYRAVLGPALPVDYLVWVEGQTGSLKSSVIAVFLSHWGDFDRLTLPESWSSTVNAIERGAFAVKDAWFVVDDYAPQGLDSRDLEAKAHRILRAQGNLSGRGRLRSDATARPTQPPRGLIATTGESHPPGHSVLARTLLVECEKGTVDRARLTVAQKTRARLPHAMAAFVEWAAPRLGSGELQAWTHQTFEELRTKATALSDYAHARVPEVLANAQVGMLALLRCAQDSGAITAVEAEKIAAESWEALHRIGERHARHVEAERPSRRAFAILAALLVQRKVILLPPHQAPEDAKTPPEPIGWATEDEVLLQAESAYGWIAKACRDAGEPFPLRQQRLMRDLVQDGLANGSEDRTTGVVRLGGKLRRVIRINRERLDEFLGSPFIIQDSTSDGTGNDLSEPGHVPF